MIDPVKSVRVQVEEARHEYPEVDAGRGKIHA